MNENGGLIYKQIPAIMAEIGAIAKERKNTQQGWMFRGIDDIYNTMHPLLAKYKVFTVPEVMEEKVTEKVTKGGTVWTFCTLTMRYLFFAEDGSFISAIVKGEGADPGDKSRSKAMATAHKYAFIQVCAIPTESGDDSETDSPEVIVGNEQDGSKVDAKKTQGKTSQGKSNPLPGKDPNTLEKCRIIESDIREIVETIDPKKIKTIEAAFSRLKPDDLSSRQNLHKFWINKKHEKEKQNGGTSTNQG